MSEELKPCPFCGGEADYRTMSNCVYIACAKCGCNTQTFHYKERQEAIKSWNKRPSPWNTGEPTENSDYLIAFHLWGRKENRICYQSLEWKNGHWFDPINDYNTEPYLTAWCKIEPYKEKTE